MNLSAFLATLDPATLKLIADQGPAILKKIPKEQQSLLKERVSAMSDEQKKALLTQLKNCDDPASVLKKLS